MMEVLQPTITNLLCFQKILGIKHATEQTSRATTAPVTNILLAQVYIVCWLNLSI